MSIGVRRVEAYVKEWAGVGQDRAMHDDGTSASSPVPFGENEVSLVGGRGVRPHHALSDGVTVNEAFPFKFGVLAYQVIGWVCIALFGPCLIASSIQDPGRSHFYFFFVLLAFGIYTVVAAGEFHVGPLGIRHRSLLGTRQIRWDEMKITTVGHLNGSLVFHGENKYLAVPPPQFWSGAQRADAYAFVASEIEKRKLPHQSRKKKPLEPLARICLSVAIYPIILIFAGDSPAHNRAVGVFGRSIFVLGFLGYVAVKIYQRRCEASDDDDRG